MEKEKSNAPLIIVIILIVLLVGGYIFKIAVLDTGKLDMKTETELLVEKRQSNIIQRERAQNNTSAENTLEIGEAQPADSRLEKIAKIYNNSSYVSNLKTKGYLVEAKAVGNKLTIYINGNGTVLDVPFNLDDQTISSSVTRHSKEEIKKVEDLVVFYLLDSVGVYKGLEEKTLYNVVSKEKDLSNYNSREHGFFVHYIEEENCLNVEINLDNDFSYFKK